MGMTESTARCARACSGPQDPDTAKTKILLDYKDAVKNVEACVRVPSWDEEWEYLPHHKPLAVTQAMLDDGDGVCITGTEPVHLFCGASAAEEEESGKGAVIEAEIRELDTKRVKARGEGRIVNFDDHFAEDDDDPLSQRNLMCISITFAAGKGGQTLKGELRFPLVLATKKGAFYGSQADDHKKIKTKDSRTSFTALTAPTGPGGRPHI